MSKSIKVQNNVTGDTRRVAVEEWPDLISLDSTLRTIFGGSLPNTYTLQYRDEDGDVVSITSSLELLEAAQTATRLSRGARPTLNLTVGNATASGVGSVVLNKPSHHLTVDSFLLPPLSNTSWAQTAAAANSSAASNAYQQAYKKKESSVSQVYTDECNLCSRVRRLCSGGFGWRQAVKALVLTGGRLEPAQAALEQAGVRQSESAPHRFFFDDEFCQGVNELVSAGFHRSQAVNALLRAGGVTSNAALDLAGVFKQEEESKNCDRCHTGLQLMCEHTGSYASGWFCDRCRKSGKAMAFRWKCPACDFDVCFACEPAPPSLPATAATTSTVVRNLPTSKPTSSPFRQVPNVQVVQSAEPDYSLPDSLRSTVISLEKMGFSDRMRNIELLVKHGGDVQKVATFLLQEEARKKAEEERARAREEARLRQERERHEAALRAEQKKRDQLLEKRRQEAARMAVASPEKLGQGIAHLQGMGFDAITATSSLFNAGGDLDAALEMLLKLE